nr:MAG TPA: hypothetical protein [Caudoviricetes sp.]
MRLPRLKVIIIKTKYLKNVMILQMMLLIISQVLILMILMILLEILNLN